MRSCRISRLKRGQSIPASLMAFIVALMVSCLSVLGKLLAFAGIWRSGPSRYCLNTSDVICPKGMSPMNSANSNMEFLRCRISMALAKRLGNPSGSAQYASTAALNSRSARGPKFACPPVTPPTACRTASSRSISSCGKRLTRCPRMTATALASTSSAPTATTKVWLGTNHCLGLNSRATISTDRSIPSARIALAT